MSDEAGFLRAIAADLHDDLPRLAYADWLDDRGDPRGEYRGRNGPRASAQ